MTIVIRFSLALLFILNLRAQDALAKEIPYLSSRVNDYANILSQETIAQLEATLKSHEDSTSNQIVVLTVQSLEGEVLEEFSIKVVEKWRLGTEKNDNGVLLLIAKDDRKIRIEVGSGLEGALTDGICGAIIRHQILPFFKEQQFDEGVTSGVAAMIKAARFEYSAEEESAQSEDDTPPLLLALGMFAFFLCVVGIFTTIALLSSGFATWFLYLFLTPFWLLFPIAFLGVAVGTSIYGVYAIGFLIARLYFKTNDGGKQLFKRWSKNFQSAGGSRSSGSSWSSSSSRSSSGSSFSGGGGSSSGGGSSGSW